MIDSDDEAQDILDEFFRGYLTERMPRRRLDRLLKVTETPRRKVTTNTGLTLTVVDFDGETYVIEGPDSDLEATTATDLIYEAPESTITAYVQLPDFSKDFWSSPPPLYHGTSGEVWKDAQVEGLVPMNLSRGIDNRSTGAAVFTSMEMDVPASYGDVIIEIDTAAMKRDGVTPEVSLEGPIVEYDLRQAMASLLGIEYEGQVEAGIDPETVVVYGKIPAKYLRVWGPGPVAANPGRGPVRSSRGQVTWVKPPKAAVSIARKALDRRKKLAASKRGGLSKSEAGKLGITSGIARAESIARGEEQPAEDIRDFFNRFKGTYQDAILKGKSWDESKVQQAWDIWGGTPMWKAALRALEKAGKKKGGGKMPAGFLRVNPCPPCLLLAGLNPAPTEPDIRAEQAECASVCLIETFCER